MKILIGTKNKGKVEAAQKAFSRFFENVEVEGIAVESEVPGQPINDEALQGAKNRVKNLKKYAKENDLNIDFYVAMESGITDKFGCWLNVTTAYVEDKNGDNAVGLGPAYQIPDRYIDEVKEKELSYVLAKVLKTEEQKTPQGGIVHLTKGNVTRIDLAEYAFIMALTHFVNGDVWK